MGARLQEELAVTPAEGEDAASRMGGQVGLAQMHPTATQVGAAVPLLVVREEATSKVTHPEGKQPVRSVTLGHTLS